MKTPRSLALFDLDNTLLPFDSDHQWADFLARTGRAGDPDQARARNEELLRRYDEGTLSAQEGADFMLGLLRLGTPTELAGWQRDYMREVVLPGIRPEARALVARYRDQGALCAIVTSTNAFVTRPIADALGFEHLIATVPEQDANGCYTGRMQGAPAFQAGKVARVADWLQGLNLRLQDFAQSWFYSDSINDLPLLEAVTNPVATNPSPALRQLAKDRKWPILDLFDGIRS